MLTVAGALGCFLITKCINMFKGKDFIYTLLYCFYILQNITATLCLLALFAWCLEGSNLVLVWQCWAVVITGCD